MADARFMLIQLPLEKEIAEKDVRAVLDKARDWIEVSSNSWIVWTTSSSERWYQRLQVQFGQKTRIFICGIDPKDRSGRMPREFWNFLNQERK